MYTTKSAFHILVEVNTGMKKMLKFILWTWDNNLDLQICVQCCSKIMVTLNNILILYC